MLTLDRLRTLEELGITRGSGLSPPPINERIDLEDSLLTRKAPSSTCIELSARLSQRTNRELVWVIGRAYSRDGELDNYSRHPLRMAHG